jgi:TPR repeat protein
MSEVADAATRRLASEKLAIMYELGWGVEADWEKAKHWYREAGLTSDALP